MLEKLVPFLLVIGLALPIASGGFILSYVFFYLLLTLLLLHCRKIDCDSVVFYCIFIVFFICLLSIVIDALVQDDIWFVREYVRLPFYFSLLFIVNVRFFVFMKSLTFYLSLLCLFDFIILFMFKDSYVSNVIKYAVSMPGMLDYLEGYWRHIGIGGNPNFSSFLYSICIILNICCLQSWWINDESRLFKCFMFLSIFISFVLLVVTFSRTSFVALLVAIFISNFRVKYIPFLLVFLFLSGFYLFLEPLFFDKLLARFSSFSSFSHRIDMWVNLLGYFDVKAALFGQALPAEVSVTDNDYLYYIFRYGLVVGVGALLIPWYVLFVIRHDYRFSILFPLLVFFYVSAFPGGSLTHPKTFCFLVILITFILSSFKNEKKVTERFG